MRFILLVFTDFTISDHVTNLAKVQEARVPDHQADRQATLMPRVAHQPGRVTLSIPARDLVILVPFHDEREALRSWTDDESLGKVLNKLTKL